MQERCEFENSSLHRTKRSILSKRRLWHDRHMLGPIVNPGLDYHNMSELPNVRNKRMAYVTAAPRTAVTQATSAINMQALCQWDQVYDVSSTRFPRSMVKAVCRNQNTENRCQYPTRNILDFFLNRLHQITECTEFNVDYRVLVECCSNGTYQIRPEIIRWPVACICTKRPQQ